MKSKKTSFNISQELSQNLKKLAYLTDQKQTEIVQNALEIYLNQELKKVEGIYE